MRNLLALCALLMIGFSTLCYYRGWCSVETLPSETGKNAFRVEIDRMKIAGDVMDGARAVQKFLTSESQPATEASGEKNKESGPNEKPGGKP